MLRIDDLSDGPLDWTLVLGGLSIQEGIYTLLSPTDAEWPSWLAIGLQNVEPIGFLLHFPLTTGFLVKY